MRSAIFAALAVQATATDGKCCWSKWGDASSCGNYPASGGGAFCNNDVTVTCGGDADCKNIAPPAPPPAPPAPPGPPVPPPTPYPPYPPAPPAPPSARGMELLGYLENWGPDIKWWDENMPGNCLMGCFKAAPLIEQIAPYSAVNYGFAFLSTLPDPDQDGCGTEKPAGKCDKWAGDNIYLAKASMQGSIAVNSATTVEEASPSIIAIAEVVRMAKMHPDGPKRVQITLGGWSDFARMGDAANGVKAAKLMAKFCAFTFADGVDIDMEHLTPFTDNFEGSDEFAAFAAFVTTLRTELDTVRENWVDTAQKRMTAMNNTYNALENWKKTNVKQFYESSIRFLGEVMTQPVPYLQISWTTRFNAFLPATDKWNYLYPDSGKMDKPFATDDEGRKLWPQVGDIIDTVNIMAYDAGTPDGGSLSFNFSTILSNFEILGGVDPRKINMGFEAGEQAAGGIWEGEERDEEATRDIVRRNSGGAMIWAVNPNSVQHPQASKLCPLLAKGLNPILKPTYAWGPAPVFTKCNPTDGFYPSGLGSADSDLLIV